MEKHELNIFPEMQQEDFERLRGDLLANGYDHKQPIWLYENKILDGWNRYLACQQLGLMPTYKDFSGSLNDALMFVLRTEVFEAIAKAVEAERVKKMVETKTGMKYGENSPVNSLTREKPERSNAKIAENFNTNLPSVLKNSL